MAFLLYFSADTLRLQTRIYLIFTLVMVTTRRSYEPKGSERFLGIKKKSKIYMTVGFNSNRESAWSWKLL